MSVTQNTMIDIAQTWFDREFVHPPTVASVVAMDGQGFKIHFVEALPQPGQQGAPAANS